MPIARATITERSNNARVSRLSDHIPSTPIARNPTPARIALRQPATKPATDIASAKRPSQVRRPMMVTSCSTAILTPSLNGTSTYTNSGWVRWFVITQSFASFSGLETSTVSPSGNPLGKTASPIAIAAMTTPVQIRRRRQG
jgi:hypothetical protein